MKKLLLALSLATITIVSPLSLSAKAGSSSSSSARATSNVGTKAYSASAKTQYSSTAIQPTKTIQPTTSTQSTASRPSPTTTSSTATPTHTTTNTTHTVEQSSGSGIGTAIVGSLIGSTVGTVVGNSINGNHTAGTTIVNNGQPQPYQSTGVAVTSDSQVVYQQSTARTENSTARNIFTWVMWTILALVTLTGVYFLYSYIKRRLMMKTMSYEKNIPTLANQYTKIQTLVSLNTMDSKLQLTKLCTPQMYHHLTTISSENADKGHSNVVNNIKVLDCTTREVAVDTDTNSVYHSVKIRAQFIDYFIDETGAVISGSSTIPVTDIEVWTFVLNNGESTWRLSAIEEYKS